MFLPTISQAQVPQSNAVLPWYRPIVPPAQVVPVVPPFGPALPIPSGVNSAGWGTGYSVVTTTKSRPNALLSQLYDRDITDSETVTSIVPNNALGEPMIWRVP